MCDGGDDSHGLEVLKGHWGLDLSEHGKTEAVAGWSSAC